ncbi:MAG TPA: rhodanese-like domain-containing protein, partial [Chloroflexia bacterium]|nr:rhodanese-like domain-containing protein [Chloroflexia bacterium]
MSDTWSDEGEAPEEEPVRVRPARPRDPAPVATAPARDTFPLVLGAVVGLLVIGLVAVLLLNNSATPSTPAGAGVPPAVVGATNPPVSTAGAANVPAGPTEETAPRMPLDEFKRLYDDPAKRPLIIDVRAKEAYDEGHILGAISFPESDVDTRANELPKDKLVIA